MQAEVGIDRCQSRKKVATPPCLHHLQRDMMAPKIMVGRQDAIC